MKFIVAQIGARHHYAIPRMFAQRGCLEALYTDACVNRGAGRALDLVVPNRSRRGNLGKLLQRKITGVPNERIRSTDRLLWNQLLRRKPDDNFADLDHVGRLFAEQMLRWGTGDATHIYSMFGEGIEFLRTAKKRGLKICIDVFITPIAHRIISQERERFPDWEGDPTTCDERLEPRIREIIGLADVLLCPGENVVNGLRALENAAAERIRIVAYGSGADFGGRLNKPVPGRVLFAGTAELRKGIHYFAAAAKRIDRPGCDFRVAGNVTSRVRQLPLCTSLNFLGRLSRADMVEELLSADVLVLPTLAEGSASVISEALVAGLPVITTRSAGSLVTHEQSGLLVPERDVDALVAAVQSVINERARREVLAAGARQISPMLSETSWSHRLITAVGA